MISGRPVERVSIPRRCDDRNFFCSAQSGPRWMIGRRLKATQRRSRTELTSRPFLLRAAIGVGVASFLATEFMHYLLVPGLGRSHERLLAEGLSALLVSFLTARLLQISRERHRLIIARMQVIDEMNHHIRNDRRPTLRLLTTRHVDGVLLDTTFRTLRAAPYGLR